MASLTILVPVTEGKAEHFGRFAREAVKDQSAHHQTSREHHGYTKEMVSP